jgi:hypothetical protein
MHTKFWFENVKVKEYVLGNNDCSARITDFKKIGYKAPAGFIWH